MAYGIFEQLAELTRKVKSICCSIAKINDSGAGSYKVFTALVSQGGGSNAQLRNEGDPLIKGYTYRITSNSGYDFVPLGAFSNTAGSHFICNQDITTSPSGPAYEVQYDSGAPVVVILENTIGNVWFEYYEQGIYRFVSRNLFTIDKTMIIGSTFYNVNADATIVLNSFYDDNSDYRIWLRSTIDNSPSNSVINHTPLEIRVYN